MFGGRVEIRRERLRNNPIFISMLPTQPPKKRVLFTIPHTFTENIIRLRIITALIGRNGK